jgi:hypothetical protein
MASKVSRLAPLNAKIILAPIDEQKNDPSDEIRKEFASYADAID